MKLYMNTTFGLSLLSLSLLFMSCTKLPLKENEHIIFFGDSITELGIKPNGYISLIQDSLDIMYPDLNIETIGAGISGHKVPDLDNRLERDILSKNPSTVIIYIGINDVWHSILPSLQGTPKDQYESGLHHIIKAIKSIDARIILCTPSVIGEKYDGSNMLDTLLDDYAEISRQIAIKENIELCDLRKEFKKFLCENNRDNLEKGILTYDGVHLSDMGNKIVSEMLIDILINTDNCK